MALFSLVKFFMEEIIILADLIEFLVKIYAHGIPSMSNLKIAKKKLPKFGNIK